MTTERVARSWTRCAVAAPTSEGVDLLAVVLHHRDDPLNGERRGLGNLGYSFEEEPQPVLPGPIGADAL